MSKKKQDTLSPAKYASFLKAVRTRITESRMTAYRAVNKELINLYCEIGREITERQEREGWGKAVVERLAKDLQKEFSGLTGFSAQNLWFMRQMHKEYGQAPNLLQLVREIPWGQNIAIMTRIKDPASREYYLRMTAELGWSRNVLNHQINTDAYGRQGKPVKQHNFQKTLAPALAEQADEAMKDIYALDFLGITKPVVERELERRMVNHIRNVLLEFGQGFAFMGSQYPITLNHETYYLDLLFYHRKLKALVAIELKAGKFKPEYAGKMNFYLNLLNDFVRDADENPAIGIILCGDRNRIEVDYALRGIDKPMGVAEYSLTRRLPPELKDKLPNPRKLEKQILHELGDVND